jgi:hypothetical protein
MKRKSIGFVIPSLWHCAMTRIREPSLRKRRLHDLVFCDPLAVSRVRIFQLLPELGRFASRRFLARYFRVPQS